MGTISDYFKKLTDPDELIKRAEAMFEKGTITEAQYKDRIAAIKSGKKNKNAKGGLITKTKKSKVSGRLAKRGYGKAMKGKK
tara:strand:+ start:854 stop:1099 length:246 start_codon:yes stop_codon:yes gene_type:complete